MADPIFTWTFQSSKPRAGGRLITYLIQMGEDGKLSCDCPGWIFKKKSVDRNCKHTRRIQADATAVFKSWSDGEPMPEFEEVETDSAKALSGIDKITRQGPAEYSRTLDLD